VVGGAVAIVVVAGGVAFGLWWTRGDHGPRSASVEVVSADGSAAFRACLMLADSTGERRRGLMEVTDLRGYGGMLFVFAEERPLDFWMRNTPMPLSIAFLDAEGRFVSAADMDPCDDRDTCPLTRSAGPARYAVEVPRGRLDDLGLVPGARLRKGGACAPS
jgi:uncharacterized membrane protein (UPF0127 family)